MEYPTSGATDYDDDFGFIADYEPLKDDYNLTLNATNGPMDDQEAFAFENYPYPKDILKPPLWEIIVKCVAYGVITLLAFVGNLLVVYIVWQNKRMRTTTNYFIVNLAVSDLMVTSSCTWVHLVDDLNENWVLGAFFCKFNSFAQGKWKSIFIEI